MTPKSQVIYAKHLTHTHTHTHTHTNITHTSFSYFIIGYAIWKHLDYHLLYDSKRNHMVAPFCKKIFLLLKLLVMRTQNEAFSPGSGWMINYLCGKAM